MSVQKVKRNLFNTITYILPLACVALMTACQGVSTGSSGSHPQTGALSLGSTSLNFGAVAPGVSKTLTVTATNSGTTTVTISSASVSSKYFSLSAPSLPASVAAGQSASLSVQFTPNAAGNFSAVVMMNTDASTSTLSLSVAGTGASSSGQLAISPSDLALGNVVVGTSGSASGSLSASGDNVIVTAADTNNSVFSLSGLSLPVTIPAGQSIPFTVTFSPQAAGAASGTVTFTSNAQPSTAVGTLSGSGTPAPVHRVNLSWNASTSSNISGYNVYRAQYAGSCGSFSRINSTLNTSTLYTDAAVVDGKSYCYETTAVNTGTQESGPSNIVSNVQIPSP